MRSQQASSHNGDPNWLLQLARNLRLAWRLLQDPTVPAGFKLIPIAAAIYVLFPGDLLPDFVPGLGQLDDLTVALLGLRLFIEACPSSIVARHRARLSSVDASYRVVEDDIGTERSTQRHLPAAESRSPPNAE